MDNGTSEEKNEKRTYATYRNLLIRTNNNPFVFSNKL